MDLEEESQIANHKSQIASRSTPSDIISVPPQKLTASSTIGRLWQWRDFIWTLTSRELKTRYVGSIGGAAWNIIQPLVLIAVFTILFSALLKVSPFGGGQGYLIYLVAALLPWNALQDALQRSSNVFIEYSNLVQKLPFPLESLVAQTVVVSTLNLLMSLTIFCFFLPLLGVKYSATLMLLPLAIFLQILITIGPALAVATLTPFWRDVPPMTSMVLFIGFWVTPVVYTPELLSAKLQRFFALNPVHHILRFYRACYTGVGFPSVVELLLTAAAGVVFLIVGWGIFARFHRKVPEML